MVNSRILADFTKTKEIRVHLRSFAFISGRMF